MIEQIYVGYRRALFNNGGPSCSKFSNGLEEGATSSIKSFCVSPNGRSDESARTWVGRGGSLHGLFTLLGSPPWVIIFIHEHNWIAASVESSGAPAMILGLVIAWRGSRGESPRWLDWISALCIPLGVSYSLYDFSGLTKQSQWLELSLALGFLVGTYRIAKRHSDGYLWFILMHITCGYLMKLQGYSWLFLQQIASLVFIIDAAINARRKKP